MGVVENIDPNDPSFVKGISGEYVHVLQKPGRSHHRIHSVTAIFWFLVVVLTPLSIVD
jgi:hypothetical protein